MFFSSIVRGVTLSGLLLSLAACDTFMQEVEVAPGKFVVFAGADHTNCLMDSTAAAMFLKEKQPDGSVYIAPFGNPSIVHQRGPCGVAIEQGTGPLIWGPFAIAAERAGRPQETIQVGNVGTQSQVGGTQSQVGGTQIQGGPTANAPVNFQPGSVQGGSNVFQPGSFVANGGNATASASQHQTARGGAGGQANNGGIKFTPTMVNTQDQNQWQQQRGAAPGGGHVNSGVDPMQQSIMTY